MVARKCVGNRRLRASIFKFNLGPVCFHKKSLHDNSNLYASRVLKFRSHWTNSTNCSPFNLNANNTASNANSNVGARLLLIHII